MKNGRAAAAQARYAFAVGRHMHDLFMSAGVWRLEGEQAPLTNRGRGTNSCDSFTA